MQGREDADEGDQQGMTGLIGLARGGLEDGMGGRFAGADQWMA